MFGPILVIIAFFLCLFLGWFVCRTGGECEKPARQGPRMFLVAVIAVIIILLIQRYFPAQ